MIYLPKWKNIFNLIKSLRGQYEIHNMYTEADIIKGRYIWLYKEKGENHG